MSVTRDFDESHLETSNQVRVASSLRADGRFAAVTGKNHGLGWQGHQLRFDPFEKERVIAAGNIRAPNRATKQRIARDHVPVTRVERQMSGRMTGREQPIKLEFAEHGFSGFK